MTARTLCFLLLPVVCSADVSIVEIPTGVALDFSEFSAITSGSDGNLWFTDKTGRIGRMTPFGVVMLFPLPDTSSGANAITSGPDGNLWFTEKNGSRIGRITTDGVISEWMLPAGSQPDAIASGPDGNLWFAEDTRIGRISTAGEYTEFPLPVGSHARGITSGVDGNLWFTERFAKKIGRITTSGVVTEFPLNGYFSGIAIASGPDGNLWFPSICDCPARTSGIGRITTDGAFTEFVVPDPAGDLGGITGGPDGSVWFTDMNGNDFGPPSRIGRITPSGIITEFSLPETNTFPLSITAGPGGNLWFTLHGAIGRVALSSGSSMEVLPAAGSSPPSSFNLFTFTFTDPNGWQDLSIVNVLINDSLDARHACYLAAIVGSGSVALVDDAGDADGPFAGFLPRGSSGTLQNGQCAVQLRSGYASGSTLSLAFEISFTSSFAGRRVVYMAQRTASSNSGWQPLGVWNVTSVSAPGHVMATSLVPERMVAASVGSPLTVTLSDTKGIEDLGIMNLLVNDALDARGACYLAYIVSTNTLLLVDDAGDSGGPFAGAMVLNGSGASIANSQCRIDGSGSSATTSGNSLSLTLNIAFESSFAGNRVIWAAGTDAAGSFGTGWQVMGTATVQ